MYPMMLIAGALTGILTVILILTGLGVLHFEDGLLAASVNAIALLIGKAITAMGTHRKSKGDPEDQPDEDLRLRGPDKNGRGRGFGLVVVVLLIFIVATFLVAWGGCTRYVKGDRMRMEVDLGPPCVVQVYMDGDLVQRSTAAKACVISPATKDGN